jgi:hypothetical protein
MDSRAAASHLDRGTAQFRSGMQLWTWLGLRTRSRRRGRLASRWIGWPRRNCGLVHSRATAVVIGSRESGVTVTMSLP